MKFMPLMSLMHYPFVQIAVERNNPCFDAKVGLSLQNEGINEHHNKEINQCFGLHLRSSN